MSVVSQVNRYLFFRLGPGRDAMIRSLSSLLIWNMPLMA